MTASLSKCHSGLSPIATGERLESLAGSIGERNTLFFQKDGVLNVKYRTRTYYTTEQKAEMLDADRQQTAQI